jgi:hypothetical protein
MDEFCYTIYGQLNSTGKGLISMAGAKRHRLTEEEIYNWLKDIIKNDDGLLEDDVRHITNTRLRKRISVMVERFGWNLDRTDSYLRTRWQVLLWKKTKLYKGRKRTIGFSIVHTAGKYKVEFKVIGIHLQAWLERYGRTLCPNCGEISYLINVKEHGICGRCFQLKDYKCQCCHEHVYEHGWKAGDNLWSRRVPLDSSKPICKACYAKAQVDYEDILERTRSMNCTAWVRWQGDYYLVRQVFTPIEGPSITRVYSFRNKPTKKEVARLRSRKAVGYVKVKVDIEKLKYWGE